MSFTDQRVREDDSTPTRRPDLVRWGAVFAGVIIGLGFFTLFSMLWLALGFGGAGWIGRNVVWFVAGTAAAALLIGGVVAGVLAGVRGAFAGLVNGVTAWALLLVVSFIVLPGAAYLTIPAMPFGGGSAGADFTGTALWPGFWSLLVGLVLAGLGGIIGGGMRRPGRTEGRSSAAPPVPPVPSPREAHADERRATTVESDVRSRR